MYNVLMNNLMNALQLLNNLHSIKRIGPTLSAGIPPQETASIADHSYFVSCLCLILGSKVEGVDPYKTSAYALMHDWGEGVIGDWPVSSPSYSSYFDEDIRKIVKKAEKNALDQLLRDLELTMPELNYQEVQLVKFCDIYSRLFELINLRQNGFEHDWFNQMFEVQTKLLDVFDYAFIPDLLKITREIFERGYMSNEYLQKATKKTPKES